MNAHQVCSRTRSIVRILLTFLKVVRRLFEFKILYRGGHENIKPLRVQSSVSMAALAVYIFCRQSKFFFGIDRTLSNSLGNVQDCKTCTGGGQGPGKLCIASQGYMQGACTNCHYSTTGHNCSFRTSSYYIPSCPLSLILTPPAQMWIAPSLFVRFRGQPLLYDYMLPSGPIAVLHRSRLFCHL